MSGHGPVVNNENLATPVVKKLRFGGSQCVAPSDISAPKGRLLPTLLSDKIKERLIVTINDLVGSERRIYTPRRSHDIPPLSPDYDSWDYYVAWVRDGSRYIAVEVPYQW